MKVVDGDTFQLASGKRVRLLGVDAPEYDRCGGIEAKKLLSNLILNSYVLLTEEQQENYGRSLALVYSSKGFINKIVLEKGWGRTDYRKNSQRNALTTAFHAAKNTNKGIFSSLCRTLSVDTTSCNIKGNIDKNTYKKYYHLPVCRQYNQIVLEEDIGERCFATEQQAVQSGFTKAAGCPHIISFSDPRYALMTSPESYITCNQGNSTDKVDSSHAAELYKKSNNIQNCSQTNHTLHPYAPLANITIYEGVNTEYTQTINEYKRCFTSEELFLPNVSMKALLININDFVFHPTFTPGETLKKITDCFPVTGSPHTLLFISFLSSSHSIVLTGDKQELLDIVKGFIFTHH